MAISELFGGEGVPEILAQGTPVGGIDVRSANNIVAQQWQAIVEGYQRLEHPTKAQLDAVVAHAKELLVALDNAAMAEPDKYVQNTLIYNNCIAIVDSVEDLDCYEQKEDEWKRVSFPVSSSDLKIAGQKDSWEDKRDRHQAQIEQEYLSSHETDAALLAELRGEAAKIEAELDELKAEKKSKGFFNFSEKGEVKERMKPVKKRLSDVEDQIGEVEDRIEDYVEERIAELGTSFVILDF